MTLFPQPIESNSDFGPDARAGSNRETRKSTGVLTEPILREVCADDEHMDHEGARDQRKRVASPIINNIPESTPPGCTVAKLDSRLAGT